MKVAVTGPAGFVGVNLVRLLSRRGHQVIAIDQGSLDGGQAPNVTAVRADILDAAAMRSAFDGVEVVYHLAAMITLARESDVARRVNTKGARVVAEAARTAGVRRMVHCSSLHAFDHRRRRGPVDETSPGAVAAELPVYNRSKWAGEQALRNSVERGLDAVIVNPTGIFGPVDYGMSRLNRVLLMAARGRLPTGIFVDVRDVALGLWLAAEHGRTGENYLLAGYFVEFMDALRLAAKFNGRLGPRWAVPQPVLGKLSRSAPIRPTVDMLTSPRVDGTKARRELGYHPRPTAETMADLVAFFRYSGRIRGTAVQAEDALRWA